MRLAFTLSVVGFAALSTGAHAQCPVQELDRALASDGVAGDAFGFSTAVHGELAVVGAWSDGAGADSGSAYVYRWDGQGWTELRELTASDAAPGDLFGFTVGLHGDLVAVGAYRRDVGGTDAGAVYLYDRNLGGPDAFGEVTILSDPAANAWYGWSVALEGDRLAVGALFGPTQNGHAYVYERDQGGPGAWGLVTELFASDGALGDRFGRAVGVSGETIAVSADGNDDAGSSSGSAYVFERDLGGPGAWGQRAKLVAPGAMPVDHFGFDLDLHGDTLIVGTHLDDQVALGAGAGHVFERDQGGADAWGLVTKLTASDGGASDQFGRSVSVHGDSILIGAYQHDAGAPLSGAAYLFSRDQGGAGAWGEAMQLTASDLGAGHEFGFSVALEGYWAVIGSKGHEQLGDDTGAAYLFGGFEVPAPAAYCTAGSSASGCAASISGVGTPSATAATGFLLVATGVEGQKDGLFFFGTSGRQANAWGNGSSYQCVVPPVKRAGLLLGSGSSGACDGSFAQDLNARWTAQPGQNPGAGAVVQAQLWYRDPLNSSNQTTSLSDALELVVCP